MRAKMIGIAAFAALIGCVTALDALDGPPAELTDASEVAVWAQFANPTSMLYYAVEPMHFLDLDAVCPSVEVDGDNVTIRGDCTTDSGRHWFGSLQIEDYDPETDAGSYVFDRFGYDSECGYALSGYSEVYVEQGAMQFSTDLTREALGDCDEPSFTVIYSGAIWEQDQVTVAEGAGVMAVEGLGQLEAVTTDQRHSSELCTHEALSGATILSSGLHEVVVTYDGAEDCSPEHTAKWALDGEAQGELEGVSCDHSRGSLWLFLPLIGLLRRGRVYDRRSIG